MFRTSFRPPKTPFLGFALMAGLSFPALAQGGEPPLHPAEQERQAKPMSPLGPVAMETDLASTKGDPDFAWRRTWSEAPYWGGRVGYVDQAGVLRVQLRYAAANTPGADWVVVAKDVRDFQLMDWRIAVRKTDGSLWFATGELNKPLRKIDDQVAGYQMTLVDVGTLSVDGAFRHSTGGPARTIATGVRAFQVQHTGRMGVLGHDGALWLFEGGRPKGDAFRQVARGVKSFQLEREWVSYLEEGPAAKLWVAKCESFRQEAPAFAPVAEGVEDFEGEISVEMREGFPSRLRLAAVDKGGAILYGEAAEPGRIAFAAIGSGGREVHWAGEQLAAVDPGGSLRIAAMPNGQFQGFQSFGRAEGFRLTPERMLLVARTPHEVSILHPLMVEEPAPAGQESAKLDKDGPLARKSLRVDGLDLGGERYLVEGKNGERTFAAHFELSSIRPGFQRRAVTAARVQKGDRPALSFR
jgi:hypothetical protein